MSKTKMRTRNVIAHKAARGSFCLMGQILLLIGGPRLMALVWRFR